MTVSIARIAAWLLIAAIIVLTLGPPTLRPITGVDRNLEHLAAFALLGLTFGLAYPSRRMLLAFIGVAVAASMEILQQWVPGRHAYFFDFVLNSAGAWTGLFGSILVELLMRRTAKARSKD
jgi:VanZ family protein